MPAGSTLPPLLSSDGHLEVRPERWTPRMPARLSRQGAADDQAAGRRRRAPRRGAGALSRALPRSAGRANQRDVAAVRRDGRRHRRASARPSSGSREQDQDGLLAEVLFPNMQVGPRLWRTMTDDDAYRAAVRAYNDWLGEEYCAGLARPAHRARRHPVDEPGRRRRRARSTARRSGSRASTLGVFPSGKSYPTPEDDRFWAAAIDMKMPLTVHVGFDRLGPRASQPTFEYPGADPEVLKKLGRRGPSWSGWPCRSSASRPAMSLAQTDPVRRLRPPARSEDLLRRDAPGLGAVLDGGGRLLVRAPPPLVRAPAQLQAAQAAAERLRAPAHLLQRAARRARGRRAAPPHGRGPHHVRHRLPAHRVRLAEHAARSPSGSSPACRPTRPSRSRRATCWSSSTWSDTPMGQRRAGPRA